ncbi:MAG: caspase domain-containing protein [Isosphaeraceae bacterium]
MITNKNSNSIPFRPRVTTTPEPEPTRGEHPPKVIRGIRTDDGASTIWRVLSDTWRLWWFVPVGLVCQFFTDTGTHPRDDSKVTVIDSSRKDTPSEHQSLGVLKPPPQPPPEDKTLRDKPPAERTSRQERRWAVVIGVNGYMDRTIPGLKYCVADAELMFKRLTEQCGYEKDRVLLIADNQLIVDNQELPTHVPIKQNLQGPVQDWLMEAEEGDMAFVFFSGHGFLADGQLYLAPMDCNHKNLELTALRTDDLREMLRRCKARKKVLVLDCCHAGGEKGEAPTGPSSEELGEAFRAAEGLVTFASCRKDETSREWDAKGHGLFTYYLAEGLSGKADKDQNNVVDSDELYNYVLEWVHITAKSQWHAIQRPVRIIGGDVVGCFDLARLNQK